MTPKKSHMDCDLFRHTPACNSFQCKPILYFAQLLSIFFACFFYNLHVSAQVGGTDGLQKEKSWNITADEAQLDQSRDQYLATGNVVISKDDLTLSADRVRFNHKTMEVFAEGNVMLISGRDVLTGKRIEMDLNKQVGVVYEGTVFIEKNHFFIQGQHLEKTGKDSYRAQKASITSCAGEEPDWKITARNVRITVEGYGTAQHAALWAKNMPVLYSPYLMFPVKRERQTGFLTPQLGYSDRKGTEYIQPFFWAIDQSSDATFYEHYMGRRGNKIGAEYRYILSSETKGTIMGDVLTDRKVDDGTGSSSEKWGYEDDPYLRPNKDRYWLRMTHDQGLPLGFTARLDLDIVSDQDYLQEFKDGYSGYNETKSYFLKEYARDLDDYNDPVRVNQLRINKKWNLYNFNTQALWYDDVIKRRQEDRDTTLQKLPSVSFDALRQPITGSPFFYDLTSDYTYFFREESYTGHRMDVYPRFYVPIKYKNYFAFEPSVGLRETLYYLDDREDFSDNGDKSLSRQLLDARLDFSTELLRSYDLNTATGKKIKHVIRPQVIYGFTPPTSQDRLPLFDELDRVNKRSVATYAITNTFSLRSGISGKDVKQSTLKKSSDDNSYNSDAVAYAYRPLCRLKLEQSYDFNETIEDRPFSPIFAELDLTAGRFLYLRADAQYSTYDNRLLNHNMAIRVSNSRGDRIFLEHRYAEDFQENFYGDVIIKLQERISMFAEYERNIKDSKTLLYGIGFLYMASCWSLDVGYSNEEGDKKYALMVNLYGLGGLGEAYAGRMIENPFEFR
ncbi:MAG: LPS assembly protein LptD [Desulfobacterales bacterium]